MPTEVIVALIAFLGTAVGSWSGIRISNKLVDYRLGKLEEKVAKHNQVVERTYRLEEQMKVANHRISDLEVKEEHYEHE
jgi:hypothetical protein